MNLLKKNISRNLLLLLVLFMVVSAGCKKLSRPSLGDYPEDANPPGGPLKFFAAFDGTSTNPLMNAVDSIRANFPADNPLTSVEGISGKAIQGGGEKAVKYPSANDFKNATSFTIAFWTKRAVNNNTEFYFSLKDDTYGWSHSAIFLLVEHGTATETTFKFGLMDQWLEFPDANKFPRPLLDGNWHHLAFVYDETTSKVTYYFDGAVVPAPASATNVTNGGNPRGPLNLKASNGLVLGGWNKHASFDGPTDGWVSSFGGSMDQFRMYATVLSAGEISALYSGKQ
jgi:Concanavalin A-like lectin/glucanases superfamily